MEKKLRKIQGQAVGHNGIISYEVDVNQQHITDFKILKHSETPGIFNQVIDQLKDSIIGQQSFDIDAISGATVMTQSLLSAAKRSLASNNILIDSSHAQEETHETIQQKTDIVIIGGGEAGLVAGCRALSLGQRVILLEKNGYLGGATILNGSNVVATDSKTSQKIFGDSTDTIKKLVNDVTRESKQTNDLQLTQLMANKIGYAIDFISDFAHLNYQKAETQTPEHSVDRQIELPSASSAEFIEKVGNAFKQHGGQVILGAKVEQLEYNNEGEVIGVVAESKHQTIKIKAHSVILASGGYGANEKMRGAENAGIDYYGPTTSTGDAYMFNADLNLKTKNLNWYKIYPHGVEVAPSTAKLTTYASKLATDLGAIYVNKEGQRIVNESAVYADFRDAVLRAPNKIAFLIMDARTWTPFYQQLLLHGFTEDEITKYFQMKNKAPLFVRGTLKEVANAAGINADQLQQTVASYQKYTKQGFDPEFNRDSEYLHLFEGKEYYLVEQRDRFATTLGGFDVNPRSLNLITNENQDVANYFAAGEVVGGANGHDSMPSMMNSWSISSGYIAGQQASLNSDTIRAKGLDRPNIVAVVGTNSKKSYNRQLLLAMKSMFVETANIQVQDITDIPLFNEDLLAKIPLEVKKMAENIANSDGVIIAVPEYNHAIPAALKSVLEWLSCVEYPLQEKPVMIVGTSIGEQGTVRAQMNLRQILDSPGLEAQVMPSNEFMLADAGNQFDSNNRLKDASSQAFLVDCFDNFLEFMDSEEFAATR